MMPYEEAPIKRPPTEAPAGRAAYTWEEWRALSPDERQAVKRRNREIENSSLVSFRLCRSLDEALLARKQVKAKGRGFQVKVLGREVHADKVSIPVWVVIVRDADVLKQLVKVPR